MIGRRNFFGSAARGAVAAICGAIGIRSARPVSAEPAQFTAGLIVPHCHVPPQPMSMERAASVFNAEKYQCAKWTHCPAMELYPEQLIAVGPSCPEWPYGIVTHYTDSFVIIAIAEKLEREQPLFRAAAVAGHRRHEAARTRPVI